MATIYVSGGGTALKNAIKNCADGDELIVADGTYTGGPCWGDVRKQFTMRSENGPKTCITNTWYYYRNQNKDSVIGDVQCIGFTFKNADQTGGNVSSFYCCALTHCIVENGSNAYHICGNYTQARTCLFRNNKSTTGRLSRNSTFTNCTFVNNVIADGVLNYGSTFRNCLFAGNVRSAGGTPLTNWKRTANDVYNMAGGLDLVDENGRPVKGSSAYGGGSSTYLQTDVDLAGTPWLDPPAIGCYELKADAIKPTIPTRMLPFGV